MSTTLEFVTNCFNDIYPKKSDNLIKTFDEFIKKHSNATSIVLENAFISFLAKRLRVTRPSLNISFLKNLENLKDIKNKIKILKTVDDNIPGFITENILSMPCNRGYIWMNEKFFGNLPRLIDSNTVLFEPRKGKTFIHVYNGNSHKIYEKLKGEKKQTLIKTETIKTEITETIKTEKNNSSKNTFLLLNDSESESDKE